MSNQDNLNSAQKLLIVVDMINGFIREGAMADSNIAHIIPEVVKLIENYNNSNQKVIFIKDCHSENSVEFESYPSHCVKGTTEAELVDELKKFENNSNSYEKNSTSALFANKFIEDIQKMENLREVIIVGCCTDICVLNLAIPLKNYFNQENRKIDIIIPQNAVETFDSEVHSRKEYNEISFKLLKQSGIKLV